MKRENYPRCFRTTLLIAIGNNYTPIPKEKEPCTNTLSNRYIRRETCKRIPLFNIFSRKEIDFATSRDWRRSRALVAFSSFFSLNGTERSISREHTKVFRNAWRWKIIRHEAAVSGAAGKVKLVEEKRKSTWNLSSSFCVFFPSLRSYPVFSLCIARATFLAASFLAFLLLPSRAL